MGAGCLLWESELEVLPLNVDLNFEKSKVVLFMYILRHKTLRKGISISYERKFLKGGDYSRKITGAPLPAGKLQFSTLALLRFNVVSYHCCNMLKIVVYLYIASLWNISENISSGNTSMVVKAFLKLIFVRLKKYYCFRKCGWRKTFSSRRRPIFFNQSNWIFKKFLKNFVEK